MASLGSFALEQAVWERSMKVTREPKPTLFAKQILNPCYFRDAKRFYDLVTERFHQVHGVVTTPDEVEGVARIWADRAVLSPLFEIEIQLFPYFDFYAKMFGGWTISSEAIVVPIDVDTDLV